MRRDVIDFTMLVSFIKYSCMRNCGFCTTCPFKDVTPLICNLRGVPECDLEAVVKVMKGCGWLNE